LLNKNAFRMKYGMTGMEKNIIKYKKLLIDTFFL